MSSLPPLDIDPLPKIDLRHLCVLSDDTGILQHATNATPDLHHGYCTDDNARSLIATVKLFALPLETWTQGDTVATDPDHMIILTQRYLAFLAYAFNPEHGRFRNFMQYDRSWLEEVGSEDSHARTLWGLGKTVRLAPNEDIRDLADRLMLKAVPAVEQFTYLRPRAYSLLGIDEYLRSGKDAHLLEQLRRTLAGELWDAYQANATDDWPWWEDELTWGNAKLPHAMMVAGHGEGRDEMVHAALNSLRWLLEVQTGENGQLSIIGNQGWYPKGGKRAGYAQQPIEAKSLVQACLTAAEITGDRYWARQVGRCFEWFTGRNDLGIPLYNPETGGGQDGLEITGVNTNQGAESTLAYILSVLEIHLYEQLRASGQQAGQRVTLP